MVHLMLGSAFEKAAISLSGYVFSHEDKHLSDSFFCMICTEDDDGGLHFRTVCKSGPDKEVQTAFNSEPDSSFSVELSEDKVISKDRQQAYLKNFFSSLFDERVTINAEVRTPVLHVCIYLPMYDMKLWELAQKLITAINAQNRDIKADLFMLAPDLAGLFVSEEERKMLPTLMMDYESDARKSIKAAIAFKENIETGKRLSHIIVMQNCNAEGLALDLDISSFVRIIGEFAIATMNSYYDIFQQNAELDGRPVHAFGLCVLNLDKYYYVRYLLSKAYLTILEREGLDVSDIDVNEPSHRVQTFLMGDDGRYRFYENFYQLKIKGFITDGKDEEAINARATAEIDHDIATFVANVTSFLNDDSLSLPAKRVTLAQLLGMDDDLMTGDMFNPNQLLFRDTYADCIEMFVNANNALLKKSPSNLYIDIPQPESDEPAACVNSGDEKISDTDGEFSSSGDASSKGGYPENLKNYAALSSEEIDFRKMNEDLKSYEVKIRRQTEYIRTLENDLKSCEIQKKQSEEKSKVLTKDGFRFGDTIFRTDPIENIPLEKTYEPLKGRTLPKSVDLRKNFSPIKSQGQVGSCLAFSVTSIFEYILKKNHRLDADLSERFLYYNGRLYLQQREGISADVPIEDKGIAFIDAFNTLKKEGICTEDFCRYDPTGKNKNEKPSDEAYEDGKLRLVTEAKNVELREYDIKAALNEGYPVAVAVNLYESFGSGPHGFVDMPTEEEVRNWNGLDLHSCHAMVICGYSDESKVFVVRNSWGKDFGDGGYCYMPYSYITNTLYTSQACIITGTNLVSAEQVKDDRSHEVVSFDKLNPEINAAIISVLIAEAKIEKARLVNMRTDLYSLYTVIEKRLVNPEVRSTLADGTRKRLEWEVDEIRKQKDENDLNEETRTRHLDRDYLRTGIVLGCYLLVILALRLIMSAVDVTYEDSEISLYRFFNTDFPLSEVFWGLFFAGAAAGAFIWFIFNRKRRNIHREHAEVNAELENMEDARTTGGSVKAGNMGLYLKALNIRMFLPWLTARKLSEQNRLLEQKYQVMVNYIKNLYEWYQTEKNKVTEMNPDMREPFISLLSNATLDKYYNAHANEITAGIRLSDLFLGGYTLEDEAIIKFHNLLKNKIISTLEDSLKGFTVYKYLTGKTDFEFADKRKTDIHDMLRRLEEKSEIFIRLGASPITSEAVNATTTVLMSSDISDDIQTWVSEFQKNFSVSVTHIRIESPFKLSFLKMKRLPLEECIDLYDESEQSS